MAHHLPRTTQTSDTKQRSNPISDAAADDSRTQSLIARTRRDENHNLEYTDYNVDYDKKPRLEQPSKPCIVYFDCGLQNIRMVVKGIFLEVKVDCSLLQLRQAKLARPAVVKRPMELKLHQDLHHCFHGQKNHNIDNLEPIGK
nr:hypothetical protein Iba_chr04aCG4050 [Ipomoea batatas]